MKRYLYAISLKAGVLLALLVCMVHEVQAAKLLSQEEQVELQARLRQTTPRQLVDSLVRGMDFQFIPATLNGQVDGKYAIYKYQNTPGFPMWLMMNMGGPLTVNRRLFSVTRCETKTVEGVEAWVLGMTCGDTVNGAFELTFVIEANTGKTVMTVNQLAPGLAAPTEEETNRNQTSFMFQGYIFPEYLMTEYKNARQKRNAEESQALMDRIVPKLDFRAGTWTINPTLLERQFARLVYLEKHNDTWYIRIEFPDTRNRYQKTSVLDFAIHASTAETFIRTGLYDYLYKNWMNYPEKAVFTSSN